MCPQAHAGLGEAIKFLVGVHSNLDVAQVVDVQLVVTSGACSAPTGDAGEATLSAEATEVTALPPGCASKCAVLSLHTQGDATAHSLLTTKFQAQYLASDAELLLSGARKRCSVTLEPRGHVEWPVTLRVLRPGSYGLALTAWPTRVQLQPVGLSLSSSSDGGAGAVVGAVALSPGLGSSVQAGNRWLQASPTIVHVASDSATS